MKTLLKNKKSILAALVAIFLLFPSFAYGQRSGAGIKGGLNLSTLNVDGSDANDMLPGFNAGVFARVMFSDVIGLQPEVLFSSKGVNTSYSRSFLGFDIANGETRLRINYIDIPLYIAIFPVPNFDIHLGPYVGVLMNANIDTENEILSFIDLDTEDDVDRSQFNQIDYGLSAGIAFSAEVFTLGINYSLGLRNVAKDNESMEGLIGDAKNNTIQVYVGLLF
jgi:hypothetical protein